MNERVDKISAKIFVAAVFSWLFCSTYSLARPQQGLRHEIHNLTSRDFRRVTSLPIQTTQDGMGVLLNSSSADLYLIDEKAGKLRHVNWKTQEFGDWKALDARGCSKSSFRISSVSLMAKTPNIVVLDCNRVELLDKVTFSRVRTILEDDQLRPRGFDLSPDHRLLAITVRKGREDFTRVYDTRDWKLLNESKFAHARFSPDSRLLATSVSHITKPSSAIVDQCGLQFYDSESGKLVSEWVKSVDELANVCPQMPVFFRTSQPDRIVTLSTSPTALSEWNAAQGTLIQRLVYTYGGNGPAPGPLSLDASHDRRLFGVVWYRTEPTQEYGLTIWDISKGKAVYEVLLGQRKHPVLRVVFSDDGDNLALEYADRIDIFEYNSK